MRVARRYSVTALFLEYFGESVPAAVIQIFGTDVSETALEHARGVQRTCIRTRSVV